MGVLCIFNKNGMWNLQIRQNKKLDILLIRWYNIACIMFDASCGCGETGRHARFRFWCREVCRFKSCHPHIEKIADALGLRVCDFFVDKLFLNRCIRYRIHYACGTDDKSVCFFSCFPYRVKSEKCSIPFILRVEFLLEQE